MNVAGPVEMPRDESGATCTGCPGVPSVDNGQAVPRLPAAIWVACQVDGRFYIDQRSFTASAPEVMLGLQDWYGETVPRWKRILRHTMLCQRVAVSVGTLPKVLSKKFAEASRRPCADIADQLPAHTLAQQKFPRETQPSSLEPSDMLTRAFHHPHTMVDDVGYFDRRPDFWVDSTSGDTRKVLILCSRLDKKLVAWPLSVSLVLTGLIGAVVAVCSGSVESGAQITGSVGGGVAVVLAYCIWRFD